MSEGERRDPLVRDCLEVLSTVCDLRVKESGDMTVTYGGLARTLRRVLDGWTPSERPAEVGQLPIAQEYPKLKVKYDPATGNELDRKIVHDVREEIPFMSGGWYTRPYTEA